MRFLLLILTFISISLSAAEIKGKVVGVSDGDTITVLDDMDNGRFRIRLDKIDAPEKNQAFGNKSKQVLSSLIYGKNVVVRFNKIDNYGRVLGVVFLGEKEINLIMVQDGYAWHYSYYDKTQSYIDAEKKARLEKKGLWIDPNPINPYEFRKIQKRR
jgi:endonuclease YncB( thermonuclease family)